MAKHLKIEKKGKRFFVVNEITGRVMSNHESLAEAKAKRTALYGQREKVMGELVRVSDSKPFSQSKAKKILREKKTTLRGKPITKKQKGLLGLIAGGGAPSKRKGYKG